MGCLSAPLHYEHVPALLHPLPAATTLPHSNLRARIRYTSTRQEGLALVSGNCADAREAIVVSSACACSIVTADSRPRARCNRLVAAFVEMERQQQLALRLLLVALSLITLAVLLLSAAGIYALMSFTVSRRRKEIGIPAAMGADMGQLLRGIFTRGAAQLAGDVALGAARALLADLLSGGEVLGPAGRRLVPLIAIVMIGV